jgi:hypothetical protein
MNICFHLRARDFYHGFFVEINFLLQQYSDDNK